MELFAGIDFGAKLAGTTVLCFEDDNTATLSISQSAKNSDADEWLLMQITQNNIRHIFIDAPLSLPAVYHGDGDDYFYRTADKQLKAMSPMFLGGLTARAMRLQSELMKLNITCHEAYPAARIKRFPTIMDEYDKKSKEKLKDLNKRLSSHIPCYFNAENWHQTDAVVAWWIGKDFMNNHHLVAGTSDEGMICY
jgi:uncharacterized protein